MDFEMDGWMNGWRINGLTYSQMDEWMEGREKNTS